MTDLHVFLQAVSLVEEVFARGALRRLRLGVESTVTGEARVAGKSRDG